MSSEDEQRAVCLRFGSTFEPPLTFEKVGVALATIHEIPLNGLRVVPENGTCGWYIWGGGEMSADPDFFQPVHLHHLADRCAAVLPYLALAPGYRFLIAPDHEDVWDDRALLER